MCLYIVIYIQLSMYYMGLYIGSLYSHLYYIYICYAQSTDSDHPRILLPKSRIRALRNNPRITHANLGSEDLLCKPRIRGCCCASLGSKPRPSAATNPRSIAHAKQLGHPRQRGFVVADGRAALRARSIVASLPRMAELLCVYDRSWLR